MKYKYSHLHQKMNIINCTIWHEIWHHMTQEFQKHCCPCVMFSDVSLSLELRQPLEELRWALVLFAFVICQVWSPQMQYIAWKCLWPKIVATDRCPQATKLPSDEYSKKLPEFAQHCHFDMTKSYSYIRYNAKNCYKLRKWTASQQTH